MASQASHVKHVAKGIIQNSSWGVTGMNRTLWVIQILLALIFMFTGGIKLILPVAEMNKGAAFPLPGLFLRFIGLAEVLGAVGLILPWLLRIQPALTPLAAVGLVIIMIGATGDTLLERHFAVALIPLVVGILAALVAWGRSSRVGIGSQVPS